MQAILISQTGGPDSLVYAEVGKPSPKPGEALIAVEAIGVNFIDVYFREGRYPSPLPFIPGQEAAGTVVAVGEGVNSVKPGDRVAVCGVPGTYAEFAVSPAARLVSVPDNVTSPQAAAAMLQGMTAHYLSHSTYAIQPGDDVLIHAGAGGTGLLLTQIAKKLGARVFTTVSTEQKAALSRDAGADVAILYTQVDFAAEIKRLTAGKGLPVVYDSVGRSTFEQSLTCLRPRGTMVLFGGSSGAVPPSISSASPPWGRSSSPAQPPRTTSPPATNSPPAPRRSFNGSPMARSACASNIPTPCGMPLRRTATSNRATPPER